jgi:alpha-amylase
MELKQEAVLALEEWRRAHPGESPDDLPFYMMGEVYGWEVGTGRRYDFGDRTVDFFAHGYDGLINFGFKRDGPLDSLFTEYSAALHDGPLEGVAILNYISSHDDGSPYDPGRRDPIGAGTRLLLAPGGAQIYYGDELARPLRVPDAEGDANLRSFMNWADLESGDSTAAVLAHWRKLGRFRQAHPAVGAGVQRTHQVEPYVFSRTLRTEAGEDRVLVAMGLETGVREVPVFGVFVDGTEVRDEYSGAVGVVSGGAVTMATTSGLVLLARDAPISR